MSGTYTIDPLGSGARNFPDFGSASYQLFLQGINAPVEFRVVPGIFGESWVLTPITGASATNKVTFTSIVPRGCRLVPAAPNFFFLTFRSLGAAYPVRWVVLDGFEFTGLGTAFVITDYCSDIEIKNCLFNHTNFIAGQLSPDKGGARWNIHHNRFDVSGINQSGILINYLSDVDIHHNEFYMVDTRPAIRIRSGNPSANRSKIYNNLIVASGTGLSGAILDLENATGMDVEFNTVLSADGAIAVASGGSFGVWNEFRNNIFVNLSGICLKVFSSDPLGFFADSNLYWAPNNSTLIQLDDGLATNSFADLVAWQVASGQDANSLEADPLFIEMINAPLDLQLQGGSPALGAAEAPPAWIADDLLGKPRGNPPTLGAYEGSPFASFQFYGSGCAGNGGIVPSLSYSGALGLGSVDFAITLANANGGITTKAYLAAGLSKTSIAGNPLPFDFGSGCSLLQSNDLVFSLVAGGLPGPGNGSSSLLFGIPNDPALQGQDFHFQWGVVDAAAAGIGIAFSNAGTLKL